MFNSLYQKIYGRITRDQALIINFIVLILVFILKFLFNSTTQDLIIIMIIIVWLPIGITSLKSEKK